MHVHCSSCFSVVIFLVIFTTNMFIVVAFVSSSNLLNEVAADQF